VIIPPELFFGTAIAGLALLWYYSVKEREKIARLREKAVELNDMKTKFTLAASHELMTPITVIKGYLKLMQDKVLGGLTDKQANAIGVINKYFDRLEKIKNNLAKLASGPARLPASSLQPISIDVLARLTTREIAPFLDQRKQSLSVEMREGMPMIKVDINGIQEVLLNLLLNAIRFTPDGGRITLRARDEGDSVRVEVEDTGIGIPKEKLESIFESFYEIKDIKKHSSGSIEFKSSGMGVGLAIAKNIIRSHHGRIWAESEEGKYSRFIFTIPKDT
jgi:signal transduction histidine kinase